MPYALTPTHLAPRRLTSCKLDWVCPNLAHFTFALSSSDNCTDTIHDLKVSINSLGLDEQFYQWLSPARKQDDILSHIPAIKGWGKIWYAQIHGHKKYTVEEQGLECYKGVSV